MKLRIYQESSINLLRQSLSEGHRTPVLKLPTGSGKTVIAGEIIRGALSKNKKVAFIVDRLTLVDQASSHLDGIGTDHGIIQGANERTNYTKPVQIISAQTLERRKPWPFDLALVDECHCMRKSLMELMAKWNNIHFIGLSATPWSKGLGKHYDDLIIPTTIGELMELGHLVDAEYYGPSKPDMTGVKMTAGDYNQRQAGEKTNTTELVADIVETWLKLAKGKQTIVFATNVAHSKHIVDRFREAGVTAEHIDAYTDSIDRRKAIKDFKDHEVQLLSSVGVLTTGFDAPNAEVGILARPTKSLMLHIQMIGRLLRPFEGKDKALILDHAGNCERLGFATDPTPTHLDRGEKKKAEPAEKKEALPKPCPACSFLKPAKVHACPSCGFAPEKLPGVEEKDGELEKLKKPKRYTMAEKASFYGELKTYCSQHRYKSGWLANQYRAKFGVWPNHPDIKNAPMKETQTETLNWIKHQQIRYAHRRRT